MTVLGWWSGGVTSAVAIKLALDAGTNVYPIFFETGSHDEDTQRFKKDCEQWYGRPILTLQNNKYSSVLDIVEKRRYINGPGGALCTAELKKDLRFAVEKIMPYDAQIFGFHYEPKEIKRAELFLEQYPNAKAIFPLIEQKITKPNALFFLEQAGIEKPRMYRLGYHNNNCVGCVKGDMGYWNKIRQDFPEVFAKTAAVERALGRSCIRGTFLDELDPTRGNYPEEIAPECGIYCPVEEPTKEITMTKERAQYVLKYQNQFGGFRYAFKHEFVGEHTPLFDDGITKEEDDFIRMVWTLMPGSTSYYDAVKTIAEGL